MDKSKNTNEVLNGSKSHTFDFFRFLGLKLFLLGLVERGVSFMQIALILWNPHDMVRIAEDSIDSDQDMLVQLVILRGQKLKPWSTILAIICKLA